MKLTDIIDIQISRETAAVARAAFNIPMFLATHTAFSERAKEYTSLEAVGEDFSTTSPVYIAAQRAFAQQLRPTRIVVGRRQVDSVVGSISSVANNTEYTLTINGKDYSYTSDASATDTEIVAGLEAEFALDPVTGVTFTDNGDGTFDVEVTTPGTGWSIKATSNIALTNNVATETYVDALAKVISENDTWYGLVADTHVEADVLALAADVESRKKIYGVSSSDAGIITNSTTDLASKLKDLGYQRTWVIYHPLAGEVYPEMALMAYQMQEQPGSNSWAYKTLTGVPVTRLTDSQSAYAVAKNVFTYEEIGAISATTNGKMIGGEWVDVMVFVDWLESRMRERLWFILVNSKKIPYTNAGLTRIESEVRAQLQEGIRFGGISEDVPYTVFIPNANEVDPNLRAARRAEGVTFEARISGAIHFVGIRGTVTV